MPTLKDFETKILNALEGFKTLGTNANDLEVLSFPQQSQAGKPYQLAVSFQYSTLAGDRKSIGENYLSRVQASVFLNLSCDIKQNREKYLDTWEALRTYLHNQNLNYDYFDLTSGYEITEKKQDYLLSLELVFTLDKELLK